jgi:hypothetical protein
MVEKESVDVGVAIVSVLLAAFTLAYGLFEYLQKKDKDKEEYISKKAEEFFNVISNIDEIIGDLYETLISSENLPNPNDKDYKQNLTDLKKKFAKARSTFTKIYNRIEYMLDKDNTQEEEEDKLDRYILKAFKLINVDILYDEKQDYNIRIKELLYFFRELTFITYFHVLNFKQNNKNNNHTTMAKRYIGNSKSATKEDEYQNKVGIKYRYTDIKGGVEKTSMHYLNLVVDCMLREDLPKQTLQNQKIDTEEIPGAINVLGQNNKK